MAVSIAGLTVIDMVKAVDRPQPSLMSRCWPSGGADPATGPGSDFAAGGCGWRRHHGVGPSSGRGCSPDRSGPLAVELLRDAGVLFPTQLLWPTKQPRYKALFLRRSRRGRGSSSLPEEPAWDHATGPPKRWQRYCECKYPGWLSRSAPPVVSTRPGPDLSRGIAGLTQSSLVVTLPGSTSAVADGIGVVAEVAAHLLAQMDGTDH